VSNWGRRLLWLGDCVPSKNYHSQLRHNTWHMGPSICQPLDRGTTSSEDTVAVIAELAANPAKRANSIIKHHPSGCRDFGVVVLLEAS
jgi:hypothetical protein